MQDSHSLEEKSAKKDRRRFPRVSVEFPVLLSMDTNRSFNEKAFALNISPTGMLIKTDETFEPGQKLFLSSDSIRSSMGLLAGEVKWIRQTREGNFTGLFFEDSVKFFSFLLQKGLISSPRYDHSFLQAVIGNLEDTIILVDKDLKIQAISKRQPIISVPEHEVLNKKVTEAPSILKLLLKESKLSRSDFLDVLHSNKERFFSSLKISYGSNGDKKTFFFNVILKPIFHLDETKYLLIQIKDVTSLHKLKEELKERDKYHWEQYRLTLVGHIVDELLEDIINPLSAAVGRIDLLSMKMAHYQERNGEAGIVANWLKELKIIDDLMEQITQYCTIAAKRREREKLGALDGEISFNRLVQETVNILRINSHFKDVDIKLDLSQDVPNIRGEYFDWLNALIALLQVISKEMQAQDKKEIKIENKLLDNLIVLSITHNARALRLPLEKEVGLGILELIQRKYDTTIDISGGSGSQKITFLVKNK